MIKYLALLFGVLAVKSADANGYDTELARQLWFFASASYCNLDKLEQWKCGKPCEETTLTNVKVFWNSSNENAGFSAYDGSRNAIVLVFRGTVPWLIKNWVEDIDFGKVPYPYCSNGCQVHHGFYSSFQGIQDQVLDHLKSLKSRYPSASITITGHSLGGALATHALVYVLKHGYTVKNFYTFGSPRVGDQAFFQWLHTFYNVENRFRITHGHDPVPHLPLFAQGFHHINTEAFYYTFFWVHKEVKICNDATQEDPDCSNSNWTDLDIHDHLSYMDWDQSINTITCQ